MCQFFTVTTPWACGKYIRDSLGKVLSTIVYCCGSQVLLSTWTHSMQYICIIMEGHSMRWTVCFVMLCLLGLGAQKIIVNYVTVWCKYRILPVKSLWQVHYSAHILHSSLSASDTHVKWCIWAYQLIEENRSHGREPKPCSRTEANSTLNARFWQRWTIVIVLTHDNKLIEIEEFNLTT